MSAGAVFREVLRTVNRMELPERTTKDLLAALEAGRRQNPLPLLYEAGHEAGLDREALLARASALYLGWCAGNLCDDLLDDECTYLDQPARIGPVVQLMLHHLAFARLLDSGIPAPVVSDAMSDMVHAASFARVELNTMQWTATRYREVAEMQAGRQWTSWMKLLWAGTRLESVAPAFAKLSANATFVVEDFRSQDSRFTNLSDADQREVLAWARASADELERLELRVGRYVLHGLEAHWPDDAQAADVS